VDGPYLICKVHANGAYEIADGEGFQLGLMNIKFLQGNFP